MILSSTAYKNNCKNIIKNINQSGLRSRSRSKLIKPINQSNQRLTVQLNHQPLEPTTN